MKTTAEKFQQLRNLFETHKIQGYFIPKTDPHHSEYLSPDAERLRWLTGFSGSAGSAIILKDRAALFVDGRYLLQARYEVNPDICDVIESTQASLFSWISNALPKDSSHGSSDRQSTRPPFSIGFDPWLMTWKTLETYQKRSSLSWQALPQNLIDLVWKDQPKRPSHGFQIHPLPVAGEAHLEKLRALCNTIRAKGAHGALITGLESVNWLFNLRGRDLAYVPVGFAYAVITPGIDNSDDSVEQTSASSLATLFLDLERLTPEIRGHLGPHVTLKDYDDILDFLTMQGKSGHTLWIDPDRTSVNLVGCFQKAGGVPLWAEDPTLLPKACKNPIEIQGMRETHLRDGVALTTFLHWVSEKALSQKVTERDAATFLYHCRTRWDSFLGDSFPTISATGAHGAIVHYHATEKTDARLKPQDIYLVDSGGHYQDGSTDVTRTIFLASSHKEKPSSEQKDRFTRVLKGHIALARAVFPEGTTGSQLDVLARQFLWDAGLNYAHGTGHGVGSVLNIHEGPQRISSARTDTVPLRAGMILSNEPGYYKADHYGIRLENLMLVVPVSRPDAEGPLLGFEVLTLAPFDLSLIEASLMTSEEWNWLQNYHQRVVKTLSPFLDSDVQQWLLRFPDPDPLS